jgi:hypothetical protein
MRFGSWAMNLAPFVRNIVLTFLASGIIASCANKEGPESVTVNFLNACRDGDERMIARVSICDESLPVLKWRKLSSESHRDDQGTVKAFLRDLDSYREGKNRLLEIAREHQGLFDQKPPLPRQAFSERDQLLIAERDKLIVKLERLEGRHAGMFSLLDAGVFPKILHGKKMRDFLGPYDVKIYFYFAEISSVTPNEVKIQHHVKIELAKVTIGDFKTDWLVYKINDLTE